MDVINCLLTYLEETLMMMTLKTFKPIETDEDGLFFFFFSSVDDDDFKNQSNFRTSSLQLNSFLYRFHPSVIWSEAFPKQVEWSLYSFYLFFIFFLFWGGGGGLLQDFNNSRTIASTEFLCIGLE